MFILECVFLINNADDIAVGNACVDLGIAILPKPGCDGSPLASPSAVVTSVAPIASVARSSVGGVCFLLLLLIFWFLVFWFFFLDRTIQSYRKYCPDLLLDLAFRIPI